MYRLSGLAAAAALVLVLTGCASSPRFTEGPGGGALHDGGRVPGNFSQTGTASYYAWKFHGKKTASGERYNMHDLTAAHRTLPFGIIVKVKNLDNGKTVTVRINDRGPYKKGRIIDLSLAAAKKIGLTASGVARVKITVADQR
jgi:rare lipoprotein A